MQQPLNDQSLERHSNHERVAVEDVVDVVEDCDGRVGQRRAGVASASGNHGCEGGTSTA
jgi:hypothetical protein